MVYTSGDEVEDRDVRFAERRVSDFRVEFVGLATQPGANGRRVRRFSIDGLAATKSRALTLAA